VPAGPTRQCGEARRFVGERQRVLATRRGAERGGSVASEIRRSIRGPQGRRSADVACLIGRSSAPIVTITSTNDFQWSLLRRTTPCRVAGWPGRLSQSLQPSRSGRRAAGG